MEPLRDGDATREPSANAAGAFDGAERDDVAAARARGSERARQSEISRNFVRIFRRQIGRAGLAMSALGLAAQPLAGILAGRSMSTIAIVCGMSAICVALNAFGQMRRGNTMFRTIVISCTYYSVTLGLIYLNRGLDGTHLNPVLWTFGFVALIGLYGSWKLTWFATAFFVLTLVGGKLAMPGPLFGAGADQSWLRLASLGGWWLAALFTSAYCGRRVLSLVQSAIYSQEELQSAIDRETAANVLAAGAAELRRAHRVARIGTWRQNLLNGTLAASDELLELMALDISSPAAMRESFLSVVPVEEHKGLFGALTRAIAGSAPIEHEWHAMRPDGVLAWFWGELSVERDDAGRPTALRGVCQDVTEHRMHAERVYRLAHHDPLTGLANRTLLAKHMEEILAGAARASRPFAVLCLDLDGFKAVNDLHGHSGGDRLLKDVATRLLRQASDGDTVARLGGDEFVIVQANAEQPAAAQALAGRLVAALAEPYVLGSGEPQVNVSASIGVAVYPGDGLDAEDLLRNADTALYRAKTGGKNVSAFFRPEMDKDLRERRALERDVRFALSRNELSLAWQPLSDAAHPCAVTGFEVLLRWNHPERGSVSPERFIPIAEGCGAIDTIGAWVLKQACLQAANWPNKLRVAVNASPLQLQQGPGFVAMVKRILEETGLEANRLIIEVTEGVLIREPERVLAALRGVKSLGVQIAMDDFGTGYSSLATLRSFPVDKIKIDRSFIAGIEAENDTQDSAIVRAILGLACGLGLPVTAEGVETAIQLGMLRAAGCKEVQGWLIGRPAPIESFADLTGMAPAMELADVA